MASSLVTADQEPASLTHRLDHLERTTELPDLLDQLVDVLLQFVEDVISMRSGRSGFRRGLRPLGDGRCGRGRLRRLPGLFRVLGFRLRRGLGLVFAEGSAGLAPLTFFLPVRPRLARTLPTRLSLSVPSFPAAFMPD